MSQREATPAGSPQEASIDQCTACDGRLTRLNTALARWRHDTGQITRDPFVEQPFTELVVGRRPR